MNATTGAITGSAAATAASRSYTVTVTDGASPVHTATANFTLAVDAALTATTVVANRTAAADGAINYTPVTGAGGRGALAYSVSPPLPAGLNMNATTGAITGTTTAASGSASYTVTVTDSASPAHTATASFTLTVRGFWLTSTMGSGRIDQVGDAVSFSPATVNGNIAGTVSYSVSPALPAGLSLNTSTGLISGTPRTVVIGQDYTVTVTDSAAPGISATTAFSYEVRSTFGIATTFSTGLSFIGSATNLTAMKASGGVPDNANQPRTFTLSPALPAGLTMSQVNTGTGSGMRSNYVITGTPTVTSPETTYTITITDGSSNGSAVHRATASFNLQVSGGPFTVSVAVPHIVRDYGDSLNARPVVGQNGYGNYSYSVSPALPAGLSMNATTGFITGTIGQSVSTEQYYLVTVSDSNRAGSNTSAYSASFGIQTIWRGDGS